MKSTGSTTIRLSVTNEVRSALNLAKKRYPALSDPEILKLGLSKIVTEYNEPEGPSEDRKDISLGSAAALGKDYLDNAEEDIYTARMGKKVRFS